MRQVTKTGIAPEREIRVLAAFEGNGLRPSHIGFGMNDGSVMYTLNSTEVHGVVYELSGKDRDANGK